MLLYECWTCLCDSRMQAWSSKFMVVKDVKSYWTISIWLLGQYCCSWYRSCLKRSVWIYWLTLVCKILGIDIDILHLGKASLKVCTILGLVNLANILSERTVCQASKSDKMNNICLVWRSLKRMCMQVNKNIYLVVELRLLIVVICNIK